LRALALLALLGALAAPSRSQAQLGLVISAIRYVPNRVLDALDVVRLRVRVGPGEAFTLRAGSGLEFFRGDYRTLFAGLPGPRRGKLPRLPLGVEARSAAEAGLPDEELLWTDPGYGRAELALGFQAGVLGLEFGVDPLQILDLGFGLISLDPLDDDW
jgi:hypothetical protein